MRKSIFTAYHDLFTERLIELRIASGLTQRDLAAILKVPRSTVARIELGERRVDFIELYHLLLVLDTDPKKEMANLISKFSQV